jgi:hypothetical protein
MKRGTPDHPKTLRLARRLDVWPVTAAGLLECLWHWTTKYRPAGDIGRGHDAADIEMGCKWPGKPGACVQAMIAERWIDELDGVLVVHDWSEHADEAVHRALARDHKFFADGEMPRISGLGRDERPAAAAFYESVSPQGGHVVATCGPLNGSRGSLPCPAPPRPASTNEPPLPPSAFAEGGLRSRSRKQLEHDRDEVLADWIRLGGRPNRRQRHEVFELLQQGWGVEEVKAAAAERCDLDATKAGKPVSEWPLTPVAAQPP